MIAIREAIESDIPAILRLYMAAAVGAGESFTEEEAREQFAVIRSYPNYRLFVAVLEEKIVGTYELLIMDNLAKRGRRSGVVEDVAVDPDYQGRGIGRAMMEHAREECCKAGCYKFALSSNLNREDAHRFYDSLGFERHGYSFRVEL